MNLPTWLQPFQTLAAGFVLAVATILFAALMATTHVLDGSTSFSLVLAVFGATGISAAAIISTPTKPNAQVIVHIVIVLLVMAVIGWLAAKHYYSGAEVLSFVALLLPGATWVAGQVTGGTAATTVVNNYYSGSPPAGPPPSG